ncbi:MAG: hydrolase 2, exosortase A system-associated [Burkholderiaceae bacterium]|nr:hydrolase 2, exosortase A system-associated [Burkholderiaceae bacterium]
MQLPEPVTPYEASARFEPAPGGPRFVISYRPARRSVRGVVVVAPPFAEEMNKCRRMVALAARALASDGWHVVETDLFGCGDSAGEFGDAGWGQWVADLHRVVEAQPAADDGLWLWGVRAGALLLPPLLERFPAAHVMLWQPALDGAQVLNQFLRLRPSAGVFDKAPAPDRTALRERLLRGEPLEVAGYMLSPRVANEMAVSRLDLPAGFRGRVAWLEVASPVGGGPSGRAASLLQAWRARGHDVAFECIEGAPFWQTVEIAEVPELVERTVSTLARRKRDDGASGAA